SRGRRWHRVVRLNRHVNWRQTHVLRMSVSRRFRFNLVLLIGVLVSAAGLSEVSIGHLGPASLGMLFVGPALALGLLPRTQWLRMGASIFLMAGTFGLARVAAEIGRHV